MKQIRAYTKIRPIGIIISYGYFYLRACTLDDAAVGRLARCATHRCKLIISRTRHPVYCVHGVPEWPRRRTRAFFFFFPLFYAPRTENIITCDRLRSSWYAINLRVYTRFRFFFSHILYTSRPGAWGVIQPGTFFSPPYHSVLFHSARHRRRYAGRFLYRVQRIRAETIPP